MKIIYDESKAIREKAKIDAETPTLNHQAKVHNTILIITSLLCAAAVIFGLVCAYDHINEQRGGYGEWLFALYVCAYPTTLCVPIIICLVYWDNILTAKQRYPATVDYHVATQNKAVLQSAIKKIASDEILGNDYIVGLTLEDENHIVTEESVYLAFFHTQTRTDLDEITINLGEKIVYVPYKH